MIKPETISYSDGSYLPISEIFRTVQGEGPSTGTLAAFIRMYGCNLTCAHCDSKYAWDCTEQPRMLSKDTLIQLVNESLGSGQRRATLAVLSGGEPLIQQRREIFKDLINFLISSRVRIEIETNGTIAPGPWVDDLPEGSYRFVVSPKIASGLATDLPSKRLQPSITRIFAAHRSTVFKIVCSSSGELAMVTRWATDNKIHRNRIWIMPEGDNWRTHLAKTRAMADDILANGFNLSTRLHLAAWHRTRRGR